MGRPEGRPELEKARRSWAAGLYRFSGQEVFRMGAAKDSLTLRFVAWLPSRFLYWCAVHVWAVATTGHYSKHSAKDLTAAEAICRYARVKAIPGHGKDRYHDSNRKRRKKKT